MGAEPHSFFSSALDGMSGQNHGPARCICGEISAGANWIGYLVGLRAGREAEEERKPLYPNQTRFFIIMTAA